jgi:hypothetical protein
MPSITHDERGFIVFDTFADTYGSKVTVKESSSAEEYKVWVFVEPGQIGVQGAIHLNREGVDQLIAALDAWRQMDNGSA